VVYTLELDKARNGGMHRSVILTQRGGMLWLRDGIVPGPLRAAKV
jgi:hypothetical protein